MTDMDATTPGPLHRFGAQVVRAGRGIRWYVTTLMGDRAYDVYVAHLKAQHPEATPLTERQFWRQRTAEQDANPGARCC